MERGTAPGVRRDGIGHFQGERWDDLPADHAHEILDPRWAALAGLASGDVPGGDGAAARGAGSPDVGDTVGASGEDESGADR